MLCFALQALACLLLRPLFSSLLPLVTYLRVGGIVDATGTGAAIVQARGRAEARVPLSHSSAANLKSPSQSSPTPQSHSHSHSHSLPAQAQAQAAGRIFQLTVTNYFNPPVKETPEATQRKAQTKTKP
jgi:hypothetical protein